MDLQEEYFRRKKVPAYLVKYPEKTSLILKAKNDESEWQWIQLNITFQPDAQHPPTYKFVSVANPVIYASTDFSHFSQQPTRVLSDEKWEWDQYEPNILNWIKSNGLSYHAICSSEAILVSWEMFLVNYDSWFANFVPHRVSDWIASSLEENEVKIRQRYIKKVEDWIKDHHEKVFLCWRSIKQNIDSKNYADWLAEIVNDFGSNNLKFKI